MKKTVLQILFLCWSTLLISQDIQIVERFTEFELPENPYAFFHLDTNLDSLKSMKIATVKCAFANHKETSLTKVFYALRIYSNKLSANSYRIDKKDIHIDDDSSSILVSIYYTLPDYLEENFSLHPTNIIYIIGPTDFKKEKLQKIKINKKTVYLASLDYIEHKISGDETVKVSHGGITGESWKIKGLAKKPAVFLSTGGITVRPSSTSSYQVGVAISTGKLNKIDSDLGWFLISVLHKIT